MCACVSEREKERERESKTHVRDRKNESVRASDDDIMELNKNRQSNVATIKFNYDDDTNAILHYGHLVKQSTMNSFYNVNDFLESTTNVPDDPDGHGNSVESTTANNVILIVKCFVIGFIILAAIFGNMLVIVSVMQHRKLR